MLDNTGSIHIVNKIFCLPQDTLMEPAESLMLPEENNIVTAFPGHVTEESFGVSSSQVAIDVDTALEAVEGKQLMFQFTVFIKKIYAVNHSNPVVANF